MASLTFETPRKRVGHAELGSHKEKDLEELHKDTEPPMKKMAIKNRLRYWCWSGVPMHKKGGVQWLAVARTVVRQVVLSYFFKVILLTSLGYMKAAGGDPVIQAQAFASVAALTTIGFMLWRHTRGLVTQLNYAHTLAEMPHTRIGPLMQIPMVLSEIVTTFLTHWTVSAMVVLPEGPNWTAGTGGVFSTGGAIAFYLLSGFLYTLAYQHNQTLDQYTYYNKGEGTNMLNLMRMAFTVGVVRYAVAFVGFFIGMWDAADPFLGIAGCLSGGTCNTPITGAWAIGFFFTILGALIAWVAQLFTWNQNDVDKVVFQSAAKRTAKAQYETYDQEGEKSHQSKINNM